MCPDTPASKQPPKSLHAAAAHIGSQLAQKQLFRRRLCGPSRQGEHTSAVSALPAKASCILGCISKNPVSRPREVILPLMETYEITPGVLCPALHQECWAEHSWCVLISYYIPHMVITSKYWSQSSKELHHTQGTGVVNVCGEAEGTGFILSQGETTQGKPY